MRCHDPLDSDHPDSQTENKVDLCGIQANSPGSGSGDTVTGLASSRAWET